MQRQISQLHKPFVTNVWAGSADCQDLPRDAFGIIADSLQFLVNLDGSVREAQMNPNALMAHQELQAQAVDLRLQLVDILVSEDHRISQPPAALHQRLE